MLDKLFMRDATDAQKQAYQRIAGRLDLSGDDEVALAQLKAKAAKTNSVARSATASVAQRESAERLPLVSPAKYVLRVIEDAERDYGKRF